MAGLFITFEGIEGCGKSTQAKLLAEYLHKDLARTVHVTREPGGTPIAEAIRGILLDTAHTEMCRETELLLYAAARAQHVAEVIRPQMAAGTVVISDRFADSTAAYQGEARGLSVEPLTQLHQIATHGLQPDITFVIDLPVASALARLLQRYVDRPGQSHDRIECESIEFHEKVRAAYLALAKEFPQRIKIIDGLKPMEDVHHDIVMHTRKLLDL